MKEGDGSKRFKHRSSLGLLLGMATAFESPYGRRVARCRGCNGEMLKVIGKKNTHICYNTLCSLYRKEQ